MSKFSKKPASAEDFISGAEKVTSQPEERRSGSPRGEYPWEKPSVRADVIKIKTVRISEPYLLKLKFIAENSPKSAEAFIREALMPAIDKEIAKLTGK